MIKSLKKGNNLEQNLSLYGNMLAGSYNRIAAYQLAMNVTQFYDEIRESSDAVCKEKLDEITAVLQAVFLDGNADMEMLVNTIDSIRKQVIEEIHDMQAYTYFFQVYEHIFNRIEYSFKNAAPVDEEAFAAEVREFVDMGDAVISNECIQMVMGELPVRMTMMRFMDMVKKGCACYIGVRKCMAERFFEDLTNVVHPLTTDILNPNKETLYAAAQTFEAVDLKAVDEDGCKKAMTTFSETADVITDALMPRLYLAELINPLFIYLLTQNYVLAELPDTKKAKLVIKEFLKSEAKGSFLTPDEDIVGLLTELTKKQEKLTGEHMLLENAFYEIVTLYPVQIDGLALNGMYNSLYSCCSIFNEGALNQTKKRQPYFSVDAAWIDAKTIQLQNHYETLLSGTDRMVKRAQMAQLLGELPVVFDNIDEFTDYVVTSLSSCADKSEKAASVALIREMMEDDDSE